MIRNTKLIKLVNSALDNIELGLVCVKIVRSRFRAQDYEGGAWTFKAVLKRKENIESAEDLHIYCYLPLYQFDYNKQELFIKSNARYSHKAMCLSDLEIFYRDKTVNKL